MCVTSNQIFLMTILIVVAADNDSNHTKRQIYREQVLPHAGGRIPDTAFETDRLFLNRLQKEGIAVPDGVVFEQRNPQVYPFHSRDHRKVLRVALSSDGRFISKEGRYQYDQIPTIETTYLYPQFQGEKQHSTTPTTPAYPVYRQFQLHNSQLNQPKFQPKKKTSANKGPIKPSKVTHYQNLNIIHDTAVHPLETSTITTTNFLNAPGFLFNPYKHYQPNYRSNNIFNNFNHDFYNFDLYQSHANGEEFFDKGHTIDLPATGFGSNQDQFLY